MLYNLSTEIDRLRLSARIELLMAEGATVELSKKKKIRSISQNAYLHLILGFFASEYGDTVQYVKEEIFKRLVNPDVFLFERINQKTGERRSALRSSSELTTSEMTQSIDRFRIYASKEAGICLPEPNEESLLEVIRIEIERNKNYL